MCQDPPEDAVIKLDVCGAKRYHFGLVVMHSLRSYRRYCCLNAPNKLEKYISYALLISSPTFLKTTYLKIILHLKDNGGFVSKSSENRCYLSQVIFEDFPCRLHAALHVFGLQTAHPVIAGI